MPVLHIHVEGEGVWPDLADKPPESAVKLSIAALPAGMLSGAPSVMIRMDLGDGRVVVGETSLKLLLTAADAFRARHGDPR
jgi:hypothetical protein